MELWEAELERRSSKHGRIQKIHKVNSFMKEITERLKKENLLGSEML